MVTVHAPGLAHFPRVKMSHLHNFSSTTYWSDRGKSACPASSGRERLPMADLLGMELEAVPRLGTKKILEQQARKKVETLVRMVQGTSALEGQWRFQRGEVQYTVAFF